METLAATSSSLGVMARFMADRLFGASGALGLSFGGRPCETGGDATLLASVSLTSFFGLKPEAFGLNCIENTTCRSPHTLQSAARV
jgi:hypothetical protein